MTKPEAARLVAMLLQAYPQAQFAPASSAIYESELCDMDANLAMHAVRRWVRTSKWLPTIAELRAVAAEITFGPKPSGGEAWGAVVEAIQRVGSYRPAPRFTDPLVTECVRLLGWRNLCLGDNDAADRARFIQLYEDMAGKERTRVIVSPGLQAGPRPPALPAFELDPVRELDETGVVAEREPRRLTRAAMPMPTRVFAPMREPPEPRQLGPMSAKQIDDELAKLDAKSKGPAK